MVSCISWLCAIRPQPIWPILILLLGASLPKTLAGTMLGKPTIAAVPKVVLLINFRLCISLFFVNLCFARFLVVLRTIANMPRLHPHLGHHQKLPFYISIHTLCSVRFAILRVGWDRTRRTYRPAPRSHQWARPASVRDAPCFRDGS